MEIKNPRMLTRLLTGILLVLGLSVVSAAPAKAVLTKGQLQHHQPDHQEDKGKDNLLFSQLPGHDIYDDQGQMNPSEYKIGRVVGKTGNILFVVLDDGTYFRGVGNANSGDDVLVSESEGVYSVMDLGHPAWISRLDMKEVSLSGSLSSRTAPLWQQLEASMSRTAVTAPPPQPAPAYSAPAPTYQETPVRALW